MLGSVSAAVAVGLISTFTPDTGAGEWISYQILYGIGIGMAFQPPFIAVQTVLDDSTVPTALVLLSFTQIFGGIVVLSIAQNVFLNRLTGNLAMEVPGLDPNLVLNNGVKSLVQAIPAQFGDRVLGAYNGALVDVFYIALSLACLAVVSTLGIEWKSVVKREE